MIRAIILTACTAALAAALWHPHSPLPTREIATVVDGDTIRVRNGRVRIMGLDAPELHARCPQEAVMARQATERMRQLIAGGVALEPHGHDRYGRVLAVVTDAQGRDVARVMIGEGLARAYSGGRREGWCG